MEESLILKNISRHISLSDEETSYFLSLLKEKKDSEKEHIIKQKQFCKDINFVLSGILRAFYTDASGKESTIMFAISDWWITDMYCFINEKPAMLNIEALEESLICSFLKTTLINCIAGFLNLKGFSEL